MTTTQGNRAGRACRFEAKSAALSSDFGMKMLHAKFAEDADAILTALGTYTRGPRKGLPRGYVHWEKITEGGWDYRRDAKCVRLPGTHKWRVLDSEFEMGLDVSSAAREARERPIREAEQAAHEAAALARRAERDALRAKLAPLAASGKRGEILAQALVTRLSAHHALRRGDIELFRENIEIALGGIARARNL